MKSGSGTIQRAQQTDAALREKSAQLQRERSGFTAANMRVEVLATERAKAVAQLDRARAVEQQATLNLSYTEIRAPVGGTVGARALRVRPIRAGRHAADGGGSLDAVYVGRQLQGDSTHLYARRPAGRAAGDGFRGTT